MTGNPLIPEQPRGIAITPKTRKPRAKKVVAVVGANETPIMKDHAVTWETPIVEILNHPRFSDIVEKERKRLVWLEAPAGKRLVMNFRNFLEKMSATDIKIHYLDIKNKSSNLSAMQRQCIVSIVEKQMVSLISHYELQKTKENDRKRLTSTKKGH